MRLPLPTLALAASVAVAFADSSIVVLALPDLYGAFDTSIVGVAWVITSYNLVVAVLAFGLVPFAHRASPARLTALGLGLFLAASAGCAASQSLAMLIAFRCVQGVGAALLLAGALALLGAGPWIAAGTVGVSVGPALGGVLTQVFDWRAIFVAQVPGAALALLATRGRTASSAHAEEHPRARARALAANAGLALLFAALVGALFLAVLLVITVWGLSPIDGALVVSALPVAAIATRRLAAALSPRATVAGGVALLGLGLLALAFLPGRHSPFVVAALALCGAGLGLSLPALGHVSLAGGNPVRSGWLTIGARHAGLVLALALLAPLLSRSLEQAGTRATLAGTAAILDGDVSLRTKIPIARDLRDTISTTPRGRVPDLGAVFDRHGAGSSSGVRRLRDTLLGTLTGVLTRSFRTAFALCALFAAAALVPLAPLGRQPAR